MANFEQLMREREGRKAAATPSFDDLLSGREAKKEATKKANVANSYASYGVNPTAQSAIEDYRKRIEGYDWIGEGNYYYDAFSETDQARKAAGEIPEYLYKKYDFDDPDDVVLYGLGLPPKSLIRTVADKADKAKADKEEETAYEQYRAQIEAAKDRNVFKGVNIPAAVKELTKGKTPTVQSETTPVSAQDAVFGDGQPAQPAVQPKSDWFSRVAQNAKFDNPAMQSMWNRKVWEAQNMREPTEEELKPIVEELLKTGDYEGSQVRSANGMAAGSGYITAEEKALEDAKDIYRDRQNQAWLEYVGAPKDAKGNFLYGSKYDYEGRVVAEEMTQAALNAADFKPLEQLQAEADAEGKRLPGIYKTTEMMSQSSRPIYMQMTDEQKAAYYYYKDKGLGDEYLDALAPELNAKTAQADKDVYGGTVLGDALLAFTGGLESGVKGLIRLATDNYAARSEGATTQAARQNRAEVAQGDDLWSKLVGFGLDVLYSTGNMAPSLVAGTVNPALGAATIGASSAGNAMNEALKEGASKEQATLYGLMNGTAEAVLQYLLGGIGKLSGNLTGKSFGKMLAGAMSRVFKNPKVAQAFARHLGGAIDEGIEEYINGIIDPVIRNVALNEDNIFSLRNEDAIYGAIVGAFTGGLLGGGNTPTDVSNNTEATTNTPVAETPAQAEIEAPAEQTYKPEPVDTRILAGDTVILKDGSQVVVQDVDFDPINNMEMYLVEHNGQTEIVNSLNVTAQTIPETANTSSLKLGVNNQSHVTFDKMQQRQLDVLDSLAKKGGVPVIVVDRIDVGGQRAAANGSYDPKTGTIFVAADAIEGAYLYTGMHELTHHIKNFNAQGYTALENLVVDFLKTSDTYGADVLEGRINELVNKGFTREAALEEIVADSIPAVLTDQKTVEKLVRQNRPVAERIRDFLYQFWRSIKTTMDRLTGMHGRKEIAALRDNEKNIRKLYKEFDDALNAAGENNSIATSGETKNQIKTLPDGRQYVESDRNVISGNDPEKWKSQITNYINREIRKGRNVTVYAVDGDVLTITRDTAGKAQFRNDVSFPDGSSRKMTDSEFAAKLRAEAHIDELAQVSRRGKNKPDKGTHKFAKDGFNYRTAYFKDGSNYYRITMSVGMNGSIKTIYNVGKMEKAELPRFFVAQRPENSSTSAKNIPQQTEPVNPKTSTKSRTYDEALDEYGAIPKGANPARDVDVPRRMDDTTKVRQHVRTIMETGDVTEEMVEMLKEKIEQGDFSYTPESNKAVLAKVDKDIENSYATVYREWERTANGQLTPTAERIAKGERLLQIAAQKNDAETVLELTTQLAMIGTEAGRNLQAFSMLKKLGPIGEVYYLNKVARDINNNMSEKAKARYGEVKLSPGLVEEVVNAKTKAERTAAYNALVRDVASQVPSTWGDKLKAWRYMAMLTNPKTHIRNFLGNALFAPAVKMKNIIGTGLERAFLRGEDAGKRTKSLGAKKKYKDFAAQDFENVEKTLKSSGKYNVSNEIEDQRTIFGNKYKIAQPLEAVIKFNSNLLESEDAVFLKHHYKAALAQYLQAKKADLSKYTEGSKLLEDARAHAMQEALKATYRDASALTTYLTQGVHTSKKGFNIVANAFIEGALPFKKTPVNIMRRGVEYSPLGLVKTLSADLVRLKKGSIDAPTFIDNLASGLTGSGLFAVGMYLAAQGLATGGMDKKDPEDRMKLLTGEQAYAIQIGDVSYTVDWLAPLSVPFFLGVETWSAITEDKDITFATLMDSAKLALEPLFELSMLQGVSSLIETAGYDDNSVVALLGKMAQNYASQFLPSLGGAIARIADPVTRKGYVDKNEGWPTDISSFYQQAIGKIPGLSALRQPALNAWGEEEVTDDILMRMFENLVSPGYYSKIEVSPVEREIMRLFNAEDTTGVLPSEAAKYFQVNGERYDMTGEEYTAYATFRGETAYGLAKALTKNVMYRDLVTDEIRAKCIEKAFDYANQVAKQTIVPECDVDKWVGEMSKLKTPEEMADYIIDAIITENKSYEADVLGVGADVHDEAMEFYSYLKEEHGGKSNSDYRKREWLQYVNGLNGLNTEQRKWLYERAGYKWSARND